MMRHYTVTATRSPRGWWILEEPTLGAISQVKRLSEAEEDMREPIAHLAGVPENMIDISVIPQLPTAFHEHLQQAQQARAEAEIANARSAQEYRAAARVLRDGGVTLRDIGELMGVSHQRVSQLVSA